MITFDEALKEFEENKILFKTTGEMSYGFKSWAAGLLALALKPTKDKD